MRVHYKGSSTFCCNSDAPCAEHAEKYPPAQSDAPSAERFVNGLCVYCNESQVGHCPDMCGYDECKGSCGRWILRPQNAFQKCDECLVVTLAQALTALKMIHDYEAIECGCEAFEMAKDALESLK